jgi:AcrR family transcriptional regulator
MDKDSDKPLKRPLKAHAALRSGGVGQRGRLLDAIVEVVGEHGYPAAKIGEIAKRAGVSRATFYELFKNKEQCFLEAHRELAGRMWHELRGVGDGDPTRAANATVSALVSFAVREPLAFNFLTHQAMIAGPRAMDERKRLLAQLDEQIERASRSAEKSARIPDLPARILIGGVIQALGLRMRRSQDLPKDPLVDGLTQWVDSYQAPLGAHRWRSLTSDLALVTMDEDAEPETAAPPPLPRGRHRLPAAVVKRVQRERILYATADVVRAKGYAQTTVADIVAAASVSREVFYTYFHDKEQAHAEMVKFVFEQIMARSAGAFFAASEGWPAQVWEGGRAFTGLISAQPSFAYIFVESYAVSSGVERSDEFLLGFTLFLEEGYHYRPQAARVPRLVSQSIAGAVLETVAFYARHDRAVELPGLLPLITYMILAPFMGVRAANDFIDGRLCQRQTEP